MRCGNREAKLRNSRRELIEPKESKRYVQRNRQGEFKKEVSVGRSLTSDWGRHAKTQVPKGQATTAIQFGFDHCETFPGHD